MLEGILRRGTPLYLRTVRWKSHMSELLLNLFTSEALPAGVSRSVTFNGICHEDAFRYLLKAEVLRSQRTGQGYHILLIYRMGRQGTVSPIHSYISTLMFDGLAQSLRQTDYIGWYSEALIIGGVLTVVEEDSVTEVFERIQRRLKRILHTKCDLEESKCFHFKLCKQHELEDFVSEVLPTAVQ